MLQQTIADFIAEMDATRRQEILRRALDNTQPDSMIIVILRRLVSEDR